MLEKNYHVLGVMSGTSLDGIDLAEIFFSFSKTQGWDYRFGKVATIPYTEAWLQKLKIASAFSETELQSLNISYTKLLGGIINKFVATHQLENLDAVCSHGHTILHQPQNSITLQIGNLPEISEITGQTVVCDFRVQDVQLGGQGAPLVPIGDKLLFSRYDYCLNLGGFANLSKDEKGERTAYDICPVNIVLNQIANQLGLPYDDKGNIARGANISEEILKQLNALAFYEKVPPKSLGIEWVQEKVLPIFNITAISAEEKLATMTVHIAQQLARQFMEGSSVLVTGGGAYNKYLLELLQSYKNITLIVPDATLLEYKEALIFGLLGVLKLRNDINCLASVTGAGRNHSSGVIFK